MTSAGLFEPPDLGTLDGSLEPVAVEFGVAGLNKDWLGVVYGFSIFGTMKARGSDTMEMSSSSSILALWVEYRGLLGSRSVASFLHSPFGSIVTWS